MKNTRPRFFAKLRFAARTSSAKRFVLPLLATTALCSLTLPIQWAFAKPIPKHSEKSKAAAPRAQSAVATAKKTLAAPETLGGGTTQTQAVGPAPSFGLGGPNMVLVKNWNFGTNGTVKNNADMSANFYYRDQFGTINNGGKYGSNTVSPDVDNAMGGQPIEGVNSPPVRQFTPDSLKTFVTPLDKATQVQVRNHNAGNGSFMAKWRLPGGGSILGRDIVWETRVRMVTPPYFWFALWTAGNKWKWDGQAQGAEQDLMESFGYDNGNGNTNYDGRFWHSNAVASPSKDDWNFWDWGGTMKDKGIASYDATKYHIWTWVYKKDNTYAMYVDGIRVQGGSNYFWTFGNTEKDEPINMDFLFDAGWGHNQIGSVNKELDASAFDGKFYEWNYSRVYLTGDGEAPKKHVLPGTIKAADGNVGAEGVAFGKTPEGAGWRKYTVEVPTSGRYNFLFQVNSSTGGICHLEDENGVNLSGSLLAPKTAGKIKGATLLTTKPGTLSAGTHTLKWIGDKSVDLISFTANQAFGPTAKFVKTDTKTQGSWKGVYGSEGYMIASDNTVQPKYGTVSKTGWNVTWNGNGLTSEVRAPQRADGGPNDRITGQWGTNDKSYDIDCNFTDDAMHQVALYGLDWDRLGRTEDIQVIDAGNGGVLDTIDLNTYVNGKYLVWNVRGHVIFRVINNSGWTNPALSAIFFDSPAAAKKMPAPRSAT